MDRFVVWQVEAAETVITSIVAGFWIIHRTHQGLLGGVAVERNCNIGGQIVMVFRQKADTQIVSGAGNAVLGDLRGCKIHCYRHCNSLPLPSVAQCCL